MAEIESDRKRGHMQRVLRKRDGSARDAELRRRARRGGDGKRRRGRREKRTMHDDGVDDGEKKENGETLIGKILAAFGGESGKERASAIASTSQVCQKCKREVTADKASSGSHTFAEQETDKEVAAC